eukprot:GDKJ01022070.1.p1 GENE.GDKJ01022070.1~~GDKJ01022070.1.p1  ORF type:complete len:425 (-),score=139.74 GDKJ01022070.1:1365-2606(-)
MNYSFGVFLLAAAVSTADAWGGEGHRAIAALARTVMQEKYPASWNVIDTVMRSHNEDFVYTAIWADVVKSTLGFTKSWHFINTPTHQCKFIRKKDCGSDDLCLAGVLTQVVHGQKLAAEKKNVLSFNLLDVAAEIESNPELMANMIPADDSYFLSLMAQDTEEEDYIHHELISSEVEESEDDIVLLGDNPENKNLRDRKNRKNDDKHGKNDNNGKRDKDDGKKPSKSEDKHSNCQLKDGFNCWWPNERIKWAVHFIGDQHQPLHVSWAEDKGGNSITTSLGNLHGVWDTAVIRQAIQEQQDGNTGAYISSFSRNFNHKAFALADEALKQINAKGFSQAVDDWSTETAKVACDSAYLWRGQLVRTGAQLDIKNYSAVNYPVIEDRIIAGGARLAAYLHAVVEDEKQQKLTQIRI